jgi:3-carboxy-cis,cis-muconate cycloisomerase
MPESFWPGAHRADDHFADTTFREAMLAVETVWLNVLVSAGLAPADAKADLPGVVEDVHEEWLTEEAEAGGNPAMALVALLRSALEDDQPAAAAWVHIGLSDQDVIDTALILMAQDAVAQLMVDIRGQAERLAGLAAAHRGTPMVARSLTQHEAPTTFGLKVAQWLAGVLDAYDELSGLHWPIQLGGDPQALVEATATILGLAPAAPWHTRRTAITRLGDAMVRCTDAWGRIAEDVITLSRPEIGELCEAPDEESRQRPMLATLVSRAAMTTPALAANLHLASARAGDELAASWHSEWATLRDLVRRTLVAGSQTFDLVADLEVDRGRMAATLHGAREQVGAEQWSVAELAGKTPSFAYLGIAAELVDAVLERARVTLTETPREDLGPG